MESQTNKFTDTSVRINFNPGTTSNRVSDTEKAIMTSYPGCVIHHEASEKISFDFKKHHTDDLPGLSELIGDHNGGNANCHFTRAALPADSQSLEKAEAEGKLCFMPENWRSRPGTSQDGMGSGGRPRRGATLAALNETTLENVFKKALGSCTSHVKQQQLVLHGADADSSPARIPVIATCSAPAGTANGTVLFFGPKIKKLAAGFGIAAKVVLNVLIHGNLVIDNEQRAKINESNFLKHLMACASGQFVDAITGKVCLPFFDQVFLTTDKNLWGRITSFERLLVHCAHCSHLLWSSSISGKIQERNTDNEEWQFDKDTGEPKLGSTISCSCIKFDRSKVLAYCVHRAVSILADAFSRRQGQTGARKQALDLSQMHRILESDEDYTVTSRILGGSDPDGQSIIIQLQSSFADRIEGTRGLTGANAREEATHNIDGNDIATVYEPAMSEEAERIRAKTVADLNLYTERTLRGESGFQKGKTGWFDVYSVLEVYRELLDISRQSIMGKIGQIQQLAQPHEEIVNTACEELQRMRNLSGFRRWLNAFRIRRISACLQTSGLSYLRCRLEISACTIAVQQLLDKLIDFVDDRLAELSLMRQNLRQVHASSRQLADHEAARPTVSSMMLGPDLVDEEYLRDFFDGGVAAHDGPENFVHDLTARFLSQYGSLSCLAGKPPDEIEQILGRLCREAFEPRLEQRDVMTELQRCYPNESKQRQLFQQAVRQSEGRVRTVGENDEEVVWTKFGTAPNNDYAERIQSIVAKVDDKPGQWHMLIDGNHDAVSVIQIRTNISLQSIIDGLELPDDSDTWEQIIELAVDPFTAITEPPNPNDRQIRRAFAKAIITEQLVYDTARGFELRFNGQEPVQLDKDAKEAGRALARWWPYVVRIGTTFGHHIVVDDGDVAVRIEQLSSLSREDPRSALIDTRAIEEVKRQFDLLIDRARRLRTAVKKD